MKYQINLLVVSDKELACDSKEYTLDQLSVGNVSFVKKDLDKFDMIIYEGSRGSKILKSRYTSLGKII